jgi:hypothetical protein
VAEVATVATSPRTADRAQTINAVANAFATVVGSLRRPEPVAQTQTVGVSPVLPKGETIQAVINIAMVGGAAALLFFGVKALAKRR